MNSDYIINHLKTSDDELEFEGNIPDFSNNVFIIFEGNEVTNEQKNSLNIFLNSIIELKSRLESSLYNYYLESMEVYREALEEYADELMPQLSNKSDVWKYINEPSVYFPNVPNEFEIQFEATFDVEHGVRVFMKDGNIFEVSL